MCIYQFCPLKHLEWLSCHLLFVLYSRFNLIFDSVSIFPAVMITVLCIETGVEIIQGEKLKKPDLK